MSHLVYCAVCEGKCSSAAPQCPHCGHPIGTPPTMPETPPETHRQPTRQIEMTSKAHKARVVGAVVFLLIALAVAIPLAMLSYGGGVLGALLVVTALVNWFSARYAAWWDHG